MKNKNNSYSRLLASLCLSAPFLLSGLQAHADPNVAIERSNQQIKQILDRLLAKAQNGKIEQQDAEEFANDFLKAAGMSPTERTKFWTTGSYTRYKDKQNKKLAANITTGAFGIEHLFSPRLLAGVSVNFSNTHSKVTQIGRASYLQTPLRTPIDSNLTRRSLGLSPYLVWRLSDYLSIGGLIGIDHGRSKLSVGAKADTASARTAKPKDNSWYYALSVGALYPLNEKTLITGSLGLRDVYGKQKAYTQYPVDPTRVGDGLGFDRVLTAALLNAVPSRKFHTVSMPAVVSLSHRIVNWFRPNIIIGAEYDLYNKLRRATFPALSFDPTPFVDPISKRKRLGLSQGIGFNLFEELPISASFQYTHSERGRKVRADTWLGKVIMKF